MKNKLIQPTQVHVSGQTLIEVIIALGMIVLVLVALVTAVTHGIRNNRFARDQAQAREYAREGQEWIRSLRDQMGWTSFVATVRADGNNVWYCFSALPATPTDFRNLNNTAICNTYIQLGGMATTFTRRINLIVNGTQDRIDVRSEVNWTEGTRNHQSFSTLVLRDW